MQKTIIFFSNTDEDQILIVDGNLSQYDGVVIGAMLDDGDDGSREDELSALLWQPDGSFKEGIEVVNEFPMALFVEKLLEAADDLDYEDPARIAEYAKEQFICVIRAGIV